jgi:hypothetical protein
MNISPPDESRSTSEKARERKEGTAFSESFPFSHSLSLFTILGRALIWGQGHNGTPLPAHSETRTGRLFLEKGLTRTSPLP